MTKGEHPRFSLSGIDGLEDIPSLLYQIRPSNQLLSRPGNRKYKPFQLQYDISKLLTLLSY